MNGVTLYKLDYETVDSEGKPTIASGELIIPAEVPSVGPFPKLDPKFLVSYQHGTVSSRNEAPSADHAQGETMIPVFYYASRGYIVAAADYIGLGDSKRVHPYLEAKTEASAAEDMLKATYQALPQLEKREDGSVLNVPLADKLFLTGYSQGGHATMALERALENDNIKVAASTPMAGPYNLSGTAKDVLTNPYPYVSSAEVAYIVYAMNLTYGIYPSLNSVVKAPYASSLSSLFDGTHALGDVAKAMPQDPKDLLQDSFRESLLVSDPSNPFVQDLIKNDLYDWTAKTPTLLLGGGGDREVPFQSNAQFAFDKMKARGGNVVGLIKIGNLDHPAAVFPAFQIAAEWIEQYWY